METNLRLKLVGLTCANCASKIESKVNRLDSVETATLNLVTGQLNVVVKKGNGAKDIIPTIRDIVKGLEPDVEVYDRDSHSEHGAHEAHHEHEEHSITLSSSILIRFCIGLLFLGLAQFAPVTEPIKLVLFIVSYLFFGSDVLLVALKNIARGQVFDENFLMGIATIGAFAIGEYPEAVAVMLFYQIGEFFQALAVHRSQKSIKELMDIVPEFANVIEEGQMIQKKPEDVQVGEIVIIKPGEKIPLDGIVIEGKSFVDMANLIGESVPREFFVGDDILSGALNQSSILKVKVSKPYSQSTVSKILELVENAGDKKSSSEKFITKFARIYTPIVVCFAVLLAVVPTLLLKDALFSTWLSRALVFLVASCPCALVVSIPLTFFSGIGTAAGKGILIKGSNFLQVLTEVDTVVFDKTGTLTKGLFDVTAIQSTGMAEAEVLQLAYSLEKYSNHPVAKSIVKAYEKENGQTDCKISGFEEVEGHGLKGTNENGETVLVGNSKWMEREHIPFVPFVGIGTVVYVAINGTYAGSIVVSDSIRDDSARGVADLKHIGIKRTVMLTGDRKESALAIGNAVGVDEIRYELLPHQKVEQMEEIYKDSKKIIFVGDGINDAPVLKRADVGIAMGGIGSDAAIEAADIVLMSDEPSKIAEAIKIAKYTLKTAKQNTAFVLAVKLAVLVLAVFGVASMWFAVFADVGVALLTVVYSIRGILWASLKKN